MLKMSVVFHSNVPSGPRIIVANHPTESDPFILFSLFRQRASILITDVAFKVPIFGRYIKFIGHIPVNTQNGTEAFEEALEKIRQGESLIIFIEGNSSPSIDKLLKPKTGAVRLALLGNVPIVPIGISVNRNFIKTSSLKIANVPHLCKWYFNGPYSVTVGKPITVSGDVENRDLVKKTSEKIMERIKSLAKESNSRIYSLNAPDYSIRVD
ncbi:MAG: 1-acyl-sn-glycerol-3-phosphate acyltransferase [Anaerolineaceae bacterium]|nr:1-acyl-sn-glycerol-3-phosphate acyltransferase [Anaerolineaceae bacterium]